MTIINGKETAALVKQQIAEQVKTLTANGQRPPCLAAIIVGHDPASETYVKNKIQACQECGFTSLHMPLETSITQEQLLHTIEQLNSNEKVDGIIVQLPLPSHIDEGAVINAIDWRKDVDGFHPVNVGRMLIGLPAMIPATPLGILTLLQHYNIATAGKKCVVMGRSNIVGKPVAQLMMLPQYGNATVTVCHSQTKNVAEELRQADIIITAIGQPGFITADMVKSGAVVLDVGITRVADPTHKKGYRLMGDVDYEHVAPKCSYITPVPGGVGPMTVCSLMQNTLKAYNAHNPQHTPQS